MNLLQGWRRRRVAKAVVGRLRSQLARDYGPGAVYFPEQIKVAYSKERLPPHSIDLALAAFMECADFIALGTVGDEQTYRQARELLKRVRLTSPSAYGFEQDPYATGTVTPE